MLILLNILYVLYTSRGSSTFWEQINNTLKELVNCELSEYFSLFPNKH